MKIKARVRRESGSQRTEDGDRNEAAGLFRVRHIRTGLYVAAVAPGCRAMRTSFLPPEADAGIRLKNQSPPCPTTTSLFEGGTGNPVVDSVTLILGAKEIGLVLPRRKAVCVADTWIAMTGDAGVEIEPAEA